MTTTRHRPVGLEEPMLYEMLHEEYAPRSARDCEEKDSGAGYATHFNVRTNDLAKLKLEIAGSRIRGEFRVPAGELEEFNRNLVGEIEVIASLGKEGV